MWGRGERVCGEGCTRGAGSNEVFANFLSTMFYKNIEYPFVYISKYPLRRSTKKEASRWRECVNTTKYFYKFHYCPNMAGKKDTDSNLEIK